MESDLWYEVDVLLVYRYVVGEGYLSTDRFGGELELNDLEPVDAFYVKCVEEHPRLVGFIWSDGVQGVSNKDLAAGWNLVSTAGLLDAYSVMSPLRYIDVGGAGSWPDDHRKPGVLPAQSWFLPADPDSA